MNRRMWRCAAWALAAVAGAACADARSEVGGAAEVRLPAEDRALAAPAPLFTLGREQGAEWETFTHLAGAAFDARDNLYVLDGGAARVLVFGPDGRFLRQVGRRGGGPGELRHPARIVVAADGAVVVSDLAARAFVVYGPDGRFRERVPFAEREMGGLELAPHPRGGFVTAYFPAPGTGARAGEMEWVWYPGGAKGRALHRLALDGTAASAAAVSPDQPVFLPAIHWGVLPDGSLALARTAGYAVEVRGAGGGVSRVLTRPFPPREVTGADRDRERERRIEVLSGREAAAIAPGVRAALEAQVRALRFADRVPAVRRMVADPAGTLWVERWPEGDARDGPVDLVAADGRYLGTLPPDRLPVAFSPSGRVAYVREDELGVQQVVVGRLPAGAR